MHFISNRLSRLFYLRAWLRVDKAHAQEFYLFSKLGNVIIERFRRADVSRAACVSRRARCQFTFFEDQCQQWK